MHGTLQQIDDSTAAAVRFALPAWRTDTRAGKKPEGDWHELPTGFVAALKTVQPFVGGDAARLGVLLDGARAYATDNCVLIEVELGGELPSATIPLWLARLLIKRADAPREMRACSDSIAFAWDDGTWISGAGCGALPASLVSRFNDWREPTWALSAAWKKAFRAVAGVSDETIIIARDRIIGGRGQLAMSSEVETPVAEGTVWNPAVLGPVIKIADRIDFSSWPDPACFAFSGARGFVAGKR